MTDGQTEGYESLERATSRSSELHDTIVFLRDMAADMAAQLDDIDRLLAEDHLVDPDVERALSLLNRIVGSLRRRATRLERPEIYFKPEWHENLPYSVIK